MNPQIMTQVSPITIRRIAFTFPEQIPRYWCDDSPFRTHLLNSFTLFFPLTEKWSIRVLKKSLQQISNAQVKRDASQFMGQEGQHAHAHTLFWNNLKQQGYDIDWYLRRVSSVLKKFELYGSTAVNVAILAGFEHLTECIADFGLRHHLLDRAEPDLRRLFEWHAAEEIEHKMVAFNVLNTLTKSYLIRCFGLVIGYVYTISFVSLGVLILLWQDQKLLQFSIYLDIIQFLWIKERFFFQACNYFVQYLQFDFHPSKIDNTALYQEVINRLPLIKQE